jgi:transcription elongation factor GreA
MNKLPMTAAGHSVLEEELKRRIQVERPRLIQRIQEAIADDSNLAENSEYQAAETEREINENRIAELEDKLVRGRSARPKNFTPCLLKLDAT